MKSLLKSLIPYLPKTFRNSINQAVKNKKLSQHKQRKLRVKITLTEIENILDNLDLNCDVMIHSSTSNIGKIEGGAVNLTNLLISKINLNKFTLLAPALPFLGTTREYLEQLELFDLTSAQNAMGNISNQIMKKEMCLRSFHPTHSVIALGAQSENYIHRHENTSTPFSQDSPYYKITKNNGKILMFGVGLNSITNFHVYEDILAEHLPFKVYSGQDYSIKSSNGKTSAIIKTKVHDARMSAKRDCELARELLISNNYINTYKLGDSEVSLLDAKGLTITLLQMLLNGKSIYGNVKLNTQQKDFINQKLIELT